MTEKEEERLTSQLKKMVSDNKRLRGLLNRIGDKAAGAVLRSEVM